MAAAGRATASTPDREPAWTDVSPRRSTPGGAAAPRHRARRRARPGAGPSTRTSGSATAGRCGSTSAGSCRSPSGAQSASMSIGHAVAVATVEREAGRGWRAVTCAANVPARPAARCSTGGARPRRAAPSVDRSTRTIPLAISHDGQRVDVGDVGEDLDRSAGRSVDSIVTAIGHQCGLVRRPAGGGTTDRGPASRPACRSAGSGPRSRGCGRGLRAARRSAPEVAPADVDPAVRLGQEVARPGRAVVVGRDQHRAVRLVDEADRDRARSTGPAAAGRQPARPGRSPTMVLPMSVDGVLRRAQRARCQDLPSVWVDGA